MLDAPSLYLHSHRWEDRSSYMCFARGDRARSSFLSVGSSKPRYGCNSLHRHLVLLTLESSVLLTMLSTEDTKPLLTFTPRGYETCMGRERDMKTRYAALRVA